MDMDRDAVRAWIRTALDKTRLTPTALAQRAGLAQSTLTRFLNSDDAPMLGLRSIAKISHAAGIEPIGIGAPVRQSPGLAEADATQYTAAPRSPVQAFLDGRNATDPWQLQSTALVHAGYLPGDILIVDLNEPPKPGDVVCAQAYRWAEGRAETVFRIYEPPYLVAASSEATARKPLLVDGERVIVKGVVIASVRLRH